MINLWGIAADSADMSEQEWRSLKLSRHPSVARWHPRSPLRLMFFSLQLMSGDGRKREMH